MSDAVFGSDVGGFLKILLLSAYHATSHQYWCQGLMAAFPEHDWCCLTLPARYFNWRIRGAPLSWLTEQAAVLTQPYDLLIATSMVDLATLKGLCTNLGGTPSLCYFHENQFEYPQSRQQHASVDAQMVNLYAALAADRVVFNSAYNRDSFFAGVNRLLAKLPDHRPATIESQLQSRCGVLPVPLKALPRSGRCHSTDVAFEASRRWNLDQGAAPLKLIWASRWEYDKGPDRLLALLSELERRGVDYRIAIVGEQFRSAPEAFDVIWQRFNPRIVQFGFVASTLEYQQWLSSADIILSTSIHEFQGVAVLEGIAAGCVPVLPRRLAYPELVAAPFLYASYDTDLAREAQAAADLLERFAATRPEVPCIKHLYWSALRSEYAALMEAVVDSVAQHRDR